MILDSFFLKTKKQKKIELLQPTIKKESIMSSSSSSLPSSSSSLSSSSLANLLIKDIERKAYVGGAFVVEQRCYFDVMNPYTRKVLGQSMNCNEEVTTIALQKAINSKWKYVDATERATKLQNWAGIVRSKSQSIAELMVLEQGKIYKEAYDEVLQGAIMMEWFAEESKRIHGEMNLNRTKNNNTNNKKDFILKQPIGIVFAITPWNFPFLGKIKYMSIPNTVAVRSCIVSYNATFYLLASYDNRSYREML